MFRIPGLPVNGRKFTAPDKKKKAYAAYDAKSLLTNRWVDVHADSFRPIVREKLTPPASTIVPTYAAVDDREIVMSTMDGVSTEETAKNNDDDDDAADDATDNEVDSILARKEDEWLEQRYDRRREFKRRRSRSRMSMGRKTPAGGVVRRRRRRRNDDDDNDGSAVAPATVQQPAVENTSALLKIIEYAKGPLCVSSNLLSVYLLLSYMGVDVSRYTSASRVSALLLKQIETVVAGGGALVDSLARFTPGALVNTTERLAAPLVAATLAVLK